MTNTFLDTSQKNEVLSSTIQEILAILNRTKNGLTDELATINKDTYHFVSEILYKSTKNLSREKQTIYKILFHLIYRSECLSYGSGMMSLVFTLNLLGEMLKTGSFSTSNDYELNREFQNTVEAFKNNLLKNTHPPTFEHLERLVSLICEGDNVLKTTIVEAVKLSGVDGKIVMENGKQSNYLIEQKPGYSFKLKPYPFLLDNNVIWTRDNCRVMVVDGFVEQVSEIDHLLLQAHETKQPFVIFSTGFSEEVVATIKTNNDKGIFNVNLVRIPVDVNSINMVVDVAVVCGTIPVSSLAGQSITFTKWNELPTVEKMTIRNSDTAIEYEKSKLGVLTHLRHLLNKRNESSFLEDLENLVDLRIRALSSDTTIIHLPDLAPFEINTIRVKIDNSLRAIKALMENGVVDLDSALSDFKPDSYLTNAMLQGLKGIVSEKQMIPTLSLLVTLALSGPVAVSMLTSSGIVVTSS